MGIFASSVLIIDYDRKSVDYLLSTTIDCNFSKSNILNFLEIQFVRICFVFRMHVLETFVRDSKLSISRHKTDIDSSRSWRLA
jgi:hypothetical protein